MPGVLAIMKDFDTKEFWEARLSRAVNLKTVGNRAFSLSYNEWLYKAQRDSLELLLSKNNISIEGKHILDVGCGSGFYVNFFDEKQAGHITGMDITSQSIEYLLKQFPDYRFLVNDISADQIGLSEKFDIVSAVSVLFHIVDDDKFSNAVTNICNLVKPDGYIIISDSFKRPILPTAKHAKLRDLKDYLAIFERNNVEVVDIVPIFYLLNQTFIPFILPPIISLLGLGELFYSIDSKLRAGGISNGRGGKFLLARKAQM